MNLNPVNPQDRDDLLEIDTTGNDRSFLPTVDEVAAEIDRLKVESYAAESEDGNEPF